MAEVEEWIVLQRKAYTKWINAHLDRCGTAIENLHPDLAEGVQLIRLLEVLTGSAFPLRYEKAPKSRIHQLANADRVLEFIEREKIHTVGINSNAIVNGELKILLALIWALIRRYQIEIGAQASGDKPSGKSLKQELLEWVRQEVGEYDGVEVNNFGESFCDGLLFSALVHRLDPAFLDYDALDKSDKTPEGVHARLETAFEIAHKDAGIPMLLDSEDIAQSKIEEQSVMTYVSYFRNALVLQSRQRSKTNLLREQMERDNATLSQVQADRDALAERCEEAAAALAAAEAKHETELAAAGERLSAAEAAAALAAADLETQLAAERDAHAATREELAAERDALAATKEELTAERESHSNTRKALGGTGEEVDELKKLTEELETELGRVGALSEEQGDKLEAAAAKQASLEEQVRDLTAKLERESAARADLEKFKALVQDKLLGFESDIEGDLDKYREDLASRLGKLEENLRQESHRLPSIKEQQDDLHRQMDELADSNPKDKEARHEELAILLQQSEVEYDIHNRLKALCAAEIWAQRQSLLELDGKQDIALGDEADQRVAKISDHLAAANNVISDMMRAEARVTRDLAGKESQIQALFALMKGSALLKYKRSGKDPHKRFFFIHLFDEPVIFWSIAEKDSGEGHKFSNRDYRQARIIKVTKERRPEVGDAQIAALSFTVHTSERILDLIAPNKEVFEQWTTGMSEILDQFRRGFIGAGTGVSMRVELVLAREMGSSFDANEYRRKYQAQERNRVRETMKELDVMKGSIRGRSTSSSFFGRSRTPSSINKDKLAAADGGSERSRSRSPAARTLSPEPSSSPALSPDKSGSAADIPKIEVNEEAA